MATRALATAPAADQPPRRVSILDTVATRYGMDPKGLQSTLMATVFKGASHEEFAALLVVANEYRLNPLTKEIYAFKARGGGLVPLVSIDGWLRIMNEHPQFDGIEYQDIPDDQGKLLAIECTIYRKDRSRPIKVIEYLSECKQNTDPWKSMPARMLRHKATIQCARYAFGFSGIYTEGDVETMAEARRVTAEPLPMRNVTANRQIGAPEHDPETGEVLDEETARALDNEGFAAMEGRVDTDHGETHTGSGDGEADAAIAHINTIELAMDVNRYVASLDTSTWDDDAAERVRAAAVARIAVVKGGK